MILIQEIFFMDLVVSSNSARLQAMILYFCLFSSCYWELIKAELEGISLYKINFKQMEHNYIDYTIITSKNKIIYSFFFPPWDFFHLLHQISAKQSQDLLKFYFMNCVFVTSF